VQEVISIFWELDAASQYGNATSGRHDDIFFPRLAPLDLTSPKYYAAMTEEGLILTSTILTYISLHVRNGAQIQLNDG
jgi:hypothetical protein